MNINTSNATSFAGRFTSQKMPEGFYSREEETWLINFAERADEFMKESTRDSDVVKLLFLKFVNGVRLVHKDPNNSLRDEEIGVIAPLMKETELYCLLNKLKQHFEKSGEDCGIKANENYNDTVNKLNPENKDNNFKNIFRIFKKR